MGAKIDKELIKTLYISGLNTSEIAERLNLKSDTVQKCIKRNFDKYNLQHKRARFKLKEIEKVVNYEATKCISDSVFIKKNPSIYKTIKNGDIILDAPEETIPWDVPRILKNDNSQELYEKRIKRAAN